MGVNIVSRNVAHFLHRSVASLSVFLVVLSVLAGAFQIEAWAETGGTSPVVAPEDERQAVGVPEALEGLAGDPDTAVVTRWTVDGGGGLAATGGRFELSGTIGQPDVGFAGGGRFTLTGGFWFAPADGDCNTDGGVDLIDFNGFQPCFSGPVGGVGDGCRCFDVDEDSDVDLSDVAAFQRAFAGS